MELKKKSGRKEASPETVEVVGTVTEAGHPGGSSAHRQQEPAVRQAQPESHEMPHVSPLRKQFTLESENRKARKALRKQKAPVSDDQRGDTVAATESVTESSATGDKQFTSLRHAAVETKTEKGPSGTPKQGSTPKTKSALSPIPVEPPLPKPDESPASGKVSTKGTSMVTPRGVASQPHSYPKSSHVSSSGKRRMPLRDFLVDTSSTPSEGEHEVSTAAATTAKKAGSAKLMKRHLAKKVKGQKSSHMTPMMKRMRDLEQPPRPASAPQPM